MRKALAMKSTDPQPLARRHVLAGAGTVGALAAAATLLPAGRQPATPSTPDALAQAASDPRPGYRLTEHVAQYYRTARV